MERGTLVLMASDFSLLVLTGEPMRPMVKPRVWIMSSIPVPNLNLPYFLWPGVGS